MYPLKVLQGRKGKTSSEQFHALVHQVGGQVIVSDVLLDAQEVQTARAQSTEKQDTPTLSNL